MDILSVVLVWTDSVIDRFFSPSSGLLQFCLRTGPDRKCSDTRSPWITSKQKAILRDCGTPHYQQEEADKGFIKLYFPGKLRESTSSKANETQRRYTFMFLSFGGPDQV